MATMKSKKRKRNSASSLDISAPGWESIGTPFCESLSHQQQQPISPDVDSSGSNSTDGNFDLPDVQITYLVPEFDDDDTSGNYEPPVFIKDELGNSGDSSVALLEITPPSDGKHVIEDGKKHKSKRRKPNPTSRLLSDCLMPVEQALTVTRNEYEDFVLELGELNEEERKVVSVQRRKIHNRISATKARKSHKEQLEKIENRITSLETRIGSLVTAVTALSQKVDVLVNPSKNPFL